MGGPVHGWVDGRACGRETGTWGNREAGAQGSSREAAGRLAPADHSTLFAPPQPNTRARPPPGLSTRPLPRPPAAAGAVPDVLSGLEALTSVLLDAELPLEALPLIALWEHTAVHAAGQLQATLLARLARARALVALGLLGPAADVIASLMAGVRLPCVELPGGGALVLRAPDGAPLPAPGAPAPRYDASQPPGWEGNRECLQYIADGALAEGLAGLYGPWAVAQLAGARAAFLAAAGAVPHCWKGSSPASGQRAAAEAAGPVEQIEGAVLAKAAALLQASVADSRAALGLPALLFPAIDVSLSAAPAAAAKGGKGAPAAAAVASAAAPVKQSAGGKPPSSGATPVAGSTPRLDASASPDQLLVTAQHCHAVVTGLLQLAQVEEARCAPHRGLQWAVEAVRMLVAHHDLASSLQCSLDEQARYSLGHELWLRSKVAVASLLVALHQPAAAVKVTDGALEDAAAAKAQLQAAQLLHARAQALAQQGLAPEALQSYDKAHAKWVTGCPSPTLCACTHRRRGGHEGEQGGGSRFTLALRPTMPAVPRSPGWLSCHRLPVPAGCSRRLCPACTLPDCSWTMQR